MVRTSPFHGGNMGSNPVGITKFTLRCEFFVFWMIKEYWGPHKTNVAVGKRSEQAKGEICV